MRLDGSHSRHIEGLLLLSGHLVLCPRLLCVRPRLHGDAGSRLLRLGRHLASNVRWMLSLAGLLLTRLLDTRVLLEARMLLDRDACGLAGTDSPRSWRPNLGSGWSLCHSNAGCCLLGIPWVMLGVDASSRPADAELMLEVWGSGHVVGSHWSLLLVLRRSSLSLLLGRLLLSRRCCCLLLGNGCLLRCNLLLLLLLG